MSGDERGDARASEYRLRGMIFTIQSHLMHLTLGQGAWLCAHMIGALVAATWIAENFWNLEWSAPYSVERLVSVAWYATLTLAPCITLLPWLRWADMNNRYVAYITEHGHVHEVSISGDDMPKTYEHVMRPAFPWLAIAALVPVYTKFIVLTTFYVLSFKHVFELTSWSVTARVALGSFLTVFFVGSCVFIIHMYLVFYRWCYTDYHDKIAKVRRRVVVTRSFSRVYDPKSESAGQEAESAEPAEPDARVSKV